MEAVGSAFASVPAIFPDSNVFAQEISMVLVVATAETLQHFQKESVEV